MVRWGAGRLVGYSLLFLAGGAVVLLMIVSAAFIFSSRSQLHGTESLKAARVDRLILEFISDLVDAETAQRGFIITKKEAFLQPYENALSQFAKDAADLRLRAAEVDEGKAIAPEPVEELIRLGQAKMDLVGHNLAEFRAGNLDELRLVIASDKGRVLMDQIRQKGADIREIAVAVRIARAAAMRDTATMLRTMISLGVAMIVVLTAGATMIMIRHLRQIDEARQELIEINQELESRVRERTEAVMRTNDELQRYAYIVSHDLRAPLVNIMGFTSELESATEKLTTYVRKTSEDANDLDRADALLAVDEDIPEALGFIRSSMKRMDSLINEILKLSRAGRRVLEPVPLDTQSLVSECIDSIRQRFDEAGAEVRIEGRLPDVVSDRSALQQVFTNLLDNATKYLKDGRSGQITVRGRLERGSAVFEVEDNGRGVAEADFERIFELFRRAGVQDKPGDGIGLAHTRMLARRLGGDVSVKSDGETGTTFIVTIARDLVLRMGRNEA
ncbi:Adaptive-response sensory-kinase SasA [Pleomorphomonas sp. T1.2MG-36]|uniref:sensor histidine kinase n=1 Tax=Pleomorphomonas sp. T1.2MG-36 TaxID=3041167 RepID=UPI0024775CDF|nr:ATP-binding protein [Pleomorphomonas sp. T1.2MG-36]CAI9408153.1 Adaptive-response sensory-kinase SasA [Pleomorphomonas sp. T1.2MG-36]